MDKPRQPSVRFVQDAPTMNIRTSDTVIFEVDPMKKIFRSIFDFLPPHARGHVVAGLGEFIGTLFFLFMTFAAAQVAFIASNTTTKGNIDTSISSVTPQELLFIAVGAGFSMAVTAWTFFRISGGLFNPVVAIGMGLIGALTWARVTILCLVHTAGAIAAAYMVSALFPGGLNVGTALHPSVSYAQGTIIEMLLTSQVVFTIFMLAAEQHESTYLAPIGIGLSVFIAELIGVFWTGGALNPVRSLAPAIVTRTFHTYHWIYWVGPMAGAILAVLMYKLVKALEYETAQNDVVKQPILPKTKKQPDNGNTVPLNSVTVSPPQSASNLMPPAINESEPPAEKSGLPVCTVD